VSSHREAPEISKDPVADSSDLYAFVSPDDPDTVTIIANYVPLQLPAGGPNFFEFGDDVLYEIHIDANGDARPDITYQFRFRTELRNDRTFLYNTGPIESLDSENWNRRQFYSVTKVDAHGKSTVLARELPCPPCNVGRLSIPDYERLAADAVAPLETGEKVFAGQRADAFSAVGVHAIAVQVPLHQVCHDGTRKVRGRDPGAVIGVWTSASRRQVQVRGGDRDDDVVVGPLVQVSRLGDPLVSEVVVPAAEDKRFPPFAERPEPAGLLPVLHPGRFDHLAKLTEAGHAVRGIRHAAMSDDRHRHPLTPSGQGTVTLDIGGGVGALVIHTPGRLHGHDIEVSPVGDPAARSRAAVRPRYVRGGAVWSVVIAGLRAGRYVVWRDADTPLTEVDVPGGAVAEVDWPRGAAAA